MPTGSKAKIPVNELNYWYYQPILEKDNWVESRNSFKRLLNRELLPLSITYEAPLSKIPKSTTFIYKFCYGNLLMPWLTNEFNFSSIFLIRHPGAVIASQLKHGSWHHINNSKSYPFILPEFRNSNYFYKYKDILSKIRTPEENLAAMWAISTMHIVNHPRHNLSWKTVSYEHLYHQPKETLESLFDWIGIPIPSIIMDTIQVPSKTTIPSSLESLQSKSQIEKWRESLSNDQILRIANILNESGVDYYSMSNDFPGGKRIEWRIMNK